MRHRRQRNKNGAKSVRRLRFEQLEGRRVLAIEIALTGTEVEFIGDEFGYYVELSVDESGRLQHNVEDEALNSLVDLDATQPGDQSLSASDATLISFDLAAGGGGASIAGIDSGHISFVGGTLHFDWQMFAANSLTIFTANGFARDSGGSQLTASVSSGNELMILYGEGNDIILASAYAGSINATTNGGDDLIIGTNQSDFISAGTGDDRLFGLGGDDSLSGDEQFVAGGDDSLFGGDGDDVLFGGWGNDELYGGNGLDSAGEDLITGTFIVTKRQLNVDGFIVRNHGIESFFVNGSPGDDLIDAAQAAGRCFLYGGAGDDTIIGSKQDDDINGDDGHDSISTGDGDDFVAGGPGDDVIQAGDGNDVIIGDDGILGDDGDDDLSGGKGQDTIRGGDGDDRLDGNAGADDLDGEAGSDSVFGGPGNDNLSEDVNQNSPGDALHGGDGDDSIQVSGGVNSLSGGGGDDYIYADSAGIDDIQGGGGNDMILASLDDTFAGGGGTDTLNLATGLVTARITNQNITLDGVTRPRNGIEDFSLFARDSAFFDAGGYTAGSVLFTGSQADDVLIGSENADTLVGSTGRDSLYGRGGRDVFRADADDATVLGGAGIDSFGFYYFDNPTSLTRQQILDLLFARGIIHDIANNESLEALIS